MSQTAFRKKPEFVEIHVNILPEHCNKIKGLYSIWVIFTSWIKILAQFKIDFVLFLFLSHPYFNVNFLNGWFMIVKVLAECLEIL